MSVCGFPHNIIEHWDDLPLVRTHIHMPHAETTRVMDLGSFLRQVREDGLDLNEGDITIFKSVGTALQVT